MPKSTFRLHHRAVALTAVMTSVVALSSACGGGAGADDTGPIKVGVLTDLTGPYAVVGKNNLAVAKFTVDEINAAGGIDGRKVEILVGDSGSDPAVGAQVAQKLVEQDHVDMVIGGIASNMKEAVKSIIATRGNTTYVWPASYEGGECTKHVWSVGAIPNQQVDPVVERLLGEGKKTYFLAGNDYVYPRTVLDRVKKLVEEGGGRVVGEEYVPLDVTDTSSLQSKIISSKADALFEIVVLPATVPFIQGVVDGGFQGVVAGTLIDEASASLVGPQAEGQITAQDFFISDTDSFSAEEVAKFYEKNPDQNGLFASMDNSPAWYRGLYLWKAAVEKAGSTDADDLENTMDSASVDQLIGGPAAMEPGTRHAKLSMYVGQINADGSAKVLEKLGQIAPESCK